MSIDHFAPAVARKLGHYVYLYIDPRNEEVFYVGKGIGNRAFTHLKARRESAKVARIASIRREGHQPRIEILVHGLADEQTALKVEAAVIDLLGKENLTNLVSGYQSKAFGRMRLEQINAEYDPVPVDITHPAILIRISKKFRHTMTPQELYDATRRCWIIGKKRERVNYAMAVFKGVVREVYEIAGWFPCGATFHPEGKRQPERLASRWEFVGRLADPDVRNKYLFRSVKHYITPGSQNPIFYAHVE